MTSAVKSFCRCIKLQVRSQYWRSHYAREGVLAKIMRAFWCLVYMCYAVVVGVRFLRREVLGEHVIYRGKRCYVWNWANSDSPTLQTLEGPRETLEHCNRKEIGTIYRPSTFLCRFAGGFTWWADNWFSIAVDRRLYN